jgi:hypothetical protein
MQSLAFLWFELKLARDRLQEVFAEPKLPANTANLNEPARYSNPPALPSSARPHYRSAANKLKTNSVCGSLN